MLRGQTVLVLTACVLLNASIAAQTPNAPANKNLAFTISAEADGLLVTGILSDAAGQLAVGTDKGIIRFWPKDLLVGIRSGSAEPHSLTAHVGPVTALAWSAHSYLASAGADKKIKL